VAPIEPIWDLTNDESMRPVAPMNVGPSGTTNRQTHHRKCHIVIRGTH